MHTRDWEHGMVLRALARPVGLYLLVCTGADDSGRRGRERGRERGKWGGDTGCTRDRTVIVLVCAPSEFRAARCSAVSTMLRLTRRRRAGAQRVTRVVGVRQLGPMRASREGTATVSWGMRRRHV
jgi:hypothetical protein